MRKNELDLMEIYVYANKINGLSEFLLNQQKSQDSYLYSFGFYAKSLSFNLLKNCEKKIKKHKLNSLSFLVLKKELCSFKFYSNKDQNLDVLCKLLTKYKFYDNLLTSC